MYGRDLRPHQSVRRPRSTSAINYRLAEGAPIPPALLQVSEEVKVTCSHSSSGAFPRKKKKKKGANPEFCPSKAIRLLSLCCVTRWLFSGWLVLPKNQFFPMLGACLAPCSLCSL